MPFVHMKTITVLASKDNLQTHKQTVCHLNFSNGYYWRQEMPDPVAFSYLALIIRQVNHAVLSTVHHVIHIGAYMEQDIFFLYTTAPPNHG